MEWLLVVLLLILYPFLGGFLSIPGAIDGAALLFLTTDIAYRLSADLDNRAPGAFGLVREVKRWIQGIVAETRRPDDDDGGGPRALP